jgi:hypothetical protein
LNRWKNYFSQLLNVHNVSDVRQIEVHTVEPLVPGPSRLEVEIAIAKFKNYKSPGSDQIPAELIQAFRLLMGKPEGKRPLGRPRRRWVDNIRIDLGEVGWVGVDWNGLAKDRNR